MQQNHHDRFRAYVQGAAAQIDQKKSVARELTLPVEREILFRWDRTPQMPAEIARGLRIPRPVVDRVIKEARRKIA